MFCLNATAQYTSLPDSRIIQLDDYGDDSKWTSHTGELAFWLRSALKDGTEHVHSAGWNIHKARTGDAGNYGRIIPPYASTNFAVNLRNEGGGGIFVESPYYEDGAGTLYFEAVNNEQLVNMTVYIATNMLVGGGIAPMQSFTNSTFSYNWVEVDSVALNYTGSTGFGRFRYNFNYYDPVKFQIMRSSPQNSSFSADYNLLVIDNIRVSFPPSSVDLNELDSNINASPDFSSGILNLRCKLDRYNADQAVTDPTVSVVYRTASEQGGAFGSWVTQQLNYVSGTGDGVTGLEYSGSVVVTAEGDIEYYYSSDFDGYYASPDYTGLNYSYPTESLAPMLFYQDDGMGGSAPFTKSWAFGVVPPVTFLTFDRILLFDDYDEDYWKHWGTAAFWLNPDMRNGTYHTNDAGWKISEARTGNISLYDRIVLPDVATNYACNLRNIENSMIESPVFDEGVGTLFFEAVNGNSPVVLYVYMTTNMFDSVNWVNEELGQEEGGGLSNVWHEIAVIDLDYNTPSDFYRYLRKFNYRGKVKFKFVRSGIISGLPADSNYLVIDNIRISPPPTDVEIRKTEVVTNPGYPNANSDFTVRCYVSNTDTNVPTENRSVLLVHRWRYLSQQVNDWQTNEMSIVNAGDGNGNDEIYQGTIDAPNDVGDIEYYYISYFDGYVYESPDYTGMGFEYPSENLSPQVFREEASGGDDEFSFRLRNYDSVYGNLYVVSDQHAQPIQMDLIGDHQWRGMVPLIGVAPTNMSWNLMAEKEYFSGDESYATNHTYWSASASLNRVVPSLPYSGVFVETNESARFTVEVKDGGYMMVSFNTEIREFLITRAEYQNFNAWPAQDDYFSESSGQSDKQRFENTFDEWPLSEDGGYFEPFFRTNKLVNVYYREPFRTPLDWMAGSAAYVSERILDTEYGPEGINNFRNLALRLKGGDTDLGLGYVYNTSDTLPDGLKQINFKARVGQSSDNTQICYNKNNFVSYDYAVKVKAGAGNKSPENPSVSVIAYYQDYQNFYEFRVVQRANASDTINNVNDRRADFYLYKWVDGVPYVLKSKLDLNSNVDLTISTTTQIGLNSTSGNTVIKCSYGTLSGIVSYTDTDDPFLMGTFGLLSSECFANFSQMTYQNSTTAGDATGGSTDVLGPGISDINNGQRSDWFVPAGLYEFRTDVTPAGIYKVIPDQKLNVYIQSTEYDSDQEPAGSGTSAWTLYTTIDVPDYEYEDLSLDLEMWQSHFVMLQVGDGESDVVVDELEVRSWHGREIPDTQGNTDWLASEAWVVSNGVGVAANQVIQLNHSRADPDVDQAVRSPYLVNGMGLMEFDYRVVRPPAKLIVQRAFGYSSGSWSNVAEVVVTNVTDWAHTTAYLGSFDEGYLRVLNAREDEYTNALVELNNVVVWDEPFVDENSWRSYNSKISAADPMRLLLDESKGCFLNNDEVDEANPSPQDRDFPNLQSPVLVNGLGVLTFQARAYDAGEPATVDVWASTNGWLLPRDNWVKVKTFENIDHEFYKTYTYEPVDGSNYDSLRLETTIGGESKRVCLEEVAISEPVYPGFDIINVKLLMKNRLNEFDFKRRPQPMTYEDVHVEAFVSNKQLSPTNIVLFVDYYIGDSVWGADNWSGFKVTRRMYAVAGEDDLYRTSDTDNGYLNIPPSLVGSIPGQEDGTIVQYRVRAQYEDDEGMYLEEYQEVFVNPPWYYPLNKNEERSDEGWSPYYIVYGVPLGTVYINEINVGDVRYDNNYNTLHGIWEHAYIEIAMPFWLDLGGWSIELVKGSNYETAYTIQIPQGLPSQTSVTNGYAFFVIADAISPSVYTPVLPKVDYAYPGLSAGMPPRIKPGGYRLRRPEGMYEQVIATDDALWNGAGSSYNGQLWADSDPDGLFAYIGEEYNEGSLSRVDTNAASIYAGDSTNNWFYPLFPEWGPDHPDFAKNYTPGMPNGLQFLLNGNELFPGVSNALINSSLTQLRGTQNGRRVQNYSLKLPVGATSNVVYEIDEWYRMVSLTANSVEVLPSGSEVTNYTYDVNEIESDVNLVARINIREDLTDYENNSEVLNWVLSFDEGDLVPMFYNDQLLDLTEQYWLDANPTISNEFNCIIRNFSFDNQTNLHVLLEMKLNQNNMTNIQGGAVLKLQAKEDLSAANWDLIAQYYLTSASFGVNNQCLAVIPKPFQFMLSEYNMQKLFLRWVIEFDDPRVIINELEDQSVP